jgi:hypothetical protein
MLAIGILSMMFAAGGPSPSTGGGATINVDGAAPNEQAIIAPITTCGGMAIAP